MLKCHYIFITEAIKWREELGKSLNIEHLQDDAPNADRLDTIQWKLLTNLGVSDVGLKVNSDSAYDMLGQILLQKFLQLKRSSIHP